MLACFVEFNPVFSLMYLLLLQNFLSDFNADPQSLKACPIFHSIHVWPYQLHFVDYSDVDYYPACSIVGIVVVEAFAA